MGLLGNFAGLPPCTVPSAIVHCNQNEAGHQTIKAPSMFCWGSAGRRKHSSIYATELVKLTDKMDGICNSGKLSVRKPSELWGVFAYLWVILLYFSLDSRLIPAVLELGQVKFFFFKLIRSGIWQLSHSCQTGFWEYFQSSVAFK